MRAISSALLIFFGTVLIAMAQNPAKVGLCDLLANPARWNGVMLETRGVITLSHGAWLDGTKTCRRPFVLDGITFDSLIALTDPQDRGLALHRVPYSWDHADWNGIVTMSLQSKPGLEDIVATVVGVFETRDPLSSLINLRLPGGKFGFGDQGIAPGQILPRGFKHAVAVPMPRQ